MSTIAYPVYVDEGILTVNDKHGETICAAEIGCSERYHKMQAVQLRRIAAALNFTRSLSLEGMERKGEIDLGDALALSLDPDENFAMGPQGIVR